MIRFHNEKTGNPLIDNKKRKANKALFTLANNSIKVETPRGRRRKKYIKSKELPRYIALVHYLTQQLIKEFDEQEKRKVSSLS